MIRFRLRELMAEKAFREGHPVTITEVAEQTGISRRVLTSIANERGYNTVTDNLDRLCAYFGCQLQQLAEHLENEGTAPAVRKRGGRK